ncbi:MAG: SRPBCC family protein [Acidimicrobiales bacterium]
MEVRSDRRYRFDVSPDELWPKLASIEDYRTWWPWLRTFEAQGFAAGERWSCAVQPPLPYSLRFDVVLDEVEPVQFVTATVDGDITGCARLDIASTAEGCELHLVSTLAPANRMLRTVARIARPVVRFGHDWVIDTGLRQFTAHEL